MTAQLLPAPKWRLTKNDGTPAAGYIVYTYTTGGAVTAKPTYTTADQSVSNGASVTLNARGEADIWWDGLYYIAVYKSAADGGGLLFAMDNYGVVGSGALVFPNRIGNGSFEDGVDAAGHPNGWDVTTYTGSTFAVDDTDSAHGGNSAKGVSIGNGGAQLITENFTPCSESESLVWKFLLKSSVADVRNLVEIVWYDADQALLSATSVYDNATTNPTSWTAYQGISAPVASARYFKIRATLCHASDATAGTSRIDGIEIGASPMIGASKAIVFEGTFNYITASGTDTYVSTFVPALNALVAGCEYRVKFSNANQTTTPTWNPNSLGAKTIKLESGSALPRSAIRDNHYARLLYDGTDMILLNPSGVGEQFFDPMGTIRPGCLACDGTAVSRTTYSSLYKYLNRTATVTITIASPGVVSWTAHGLAANEVVEFATTGALPTGFVAATDYYVVGASITADTFQLSATAGGAAINTSGTQSGVHTGIHSPHGYGDGSTTFNTPDLRGRVPMGLDNLGGNSANRVTGAWADALAGTGGTETHALTAAEIPNNNILTNSTIGAAGGDTQAAHTGTGTAHPNMQPSMALPFLIRY